MAKYKKNAKYGKQNQKRDNYRDNNRGKNAREDRSSDEYGGNHISWYVPDTALLNEVASIPFNYRTGDRMRVFTGHDAADQGFIMPGLMRLGFIPTYGEMFNQASPINVAATGVYSYVRHVNSGSRNYDACDLMLYLMAMDSIYMGIADITRHLAMLTTFSKFNRYIPNAPLTAMGYDPVDGDLWGKTAYVRARLDRIILKAATLCVPATFPLYVRHNFMCTNVYFDKDNQMGQMYAFVPEWLYKFQLNREDGTGELIALPWGMRNEAMDWDRRLDMLEDMIDSIYGDEDAGIMSGDILKAYGDGNLFKLQLTDPNNAPSLVYDADMLEQIHNCMIAGEVESESLTIKQNLVEGANGLSAYLVCRPKFIIYTQVDPYDAADPAYTSFESFRRWFENDNFLFDLHHDPDPERVMRATRLMWGGCTNPVWDDEIERLSWELQSMPSEVITHVDIYTNKWNEESEVYPAYEVISVPSYLEGALNAAYFLPLTVADVNRITTFSGAPVLVYPSSDAVNSAPTVTGNLDRTTTISLSNITQLNEVAMLGLYNVPRLTLQATSNS